MIDSWLRENTHSLSGKRIAVTGATGGIGTHLVTYLARLGAELIFLDRNKGRSDSLRDTVLSRYPDTRISRIEVDMSSMDSVRAATAELVAAEPDVFIHNAGAYSIPRCVSDSGYDNVFTINFIAPYYMVRELLPTLRERQGRVVAVGSVAHNYSHADPEDVDFRTRTAASKVYGNAKRYLQFALHELFREERDASLAIVHPGITFTNITAHYPPLIFAIIKHPMKVIFMRPRKAALCVLRGVFEVTPYHTWIGPRLFGVWGYPRKVALTTCTREESGGIYARAERIYKEMKK
ncbi:MAG: SDR family NAD(P)-dependent oxidoreductase [Clostridia bacterium]|nr:SDR family NAD(P)-dependent oxidoreductase [Clostridia bacterium]